jgi:allantoinase
VTGADLVITGTRIVTPSGERPAAIVVSRGEITAVVPRDEAPPARTTVDAGNAAVLPGVVDTHVHLNEPGRTDCEVFASGTRAAAAGGVTTVVDMPL